MKKGEVVVSELVVLVLMAVSLVILIIVFLYFGRVIQDEAPKRECQWNLLLSASTKVPLVGIETLPPDCQMARKNITMDQLISKKDANKQKIVDFNKKYPNSKYTNFNPDNEKQLLEYEMDGLIAKEIKDCWEVVWFGQMPLFKQWWSLFECDVDKTTQQYECTCKPGADCSTVQEVLDRAKFWTYHYQAPPTFCVLCSRLKFDSQVTQKFSGQPIKSLPEWMQKHPIETDVQQRSYYEYTKDDVNKGLFAPDYIYSVDKPLAVVYARVNVRQTTKLADTVTSIFGLNEIASPTNALALIPYDEVGDKCTYIIG